MSRIAQLSRSPRPTFRSVSLKYFTGNGQKCLPIHYSQFCHHKNNQRRRKQVSVTAQQVLIMGWQVLVPSEASRQRFSQSAIRRRFGGQKKTCDCGWTASLGGLCSASLLAHFLKNGSEKVKKKKSGGTEVRAS